MDRYAELYEKGRHEIERVDGLRVAYGCDGICGIFVEVCDPGAGDDELGETDEVIVDVDEIFEGATAVRAAFDEWVLT